MPPAERRQSILAFCDGDESGLVGKGGLSWWVGDLAYEHIFNDFLDAFTSTHLDTLMLDRTGRQNLYSPDSQIPHNLPERASLLQP